MKGIKLTVKDLNLNYKGYTQNSIYEAINGYHLPILLLKLKNKFLLLNNVIRNNAI